MTRRPRIFYLAWTPPNGRSGATLAMRRHFLERNDFDVFVATSEEFSDARVPSLRLRRPAWLQRASNTRCCRLVRQYEMLLDARRLPASLVDAAVGFRPDAIFTVADTTISWTAYRLAQRLRVPLVTNFQDWWPRGQFYHTHERPYPPVRAWLERRFRRLHRQSAVVFCTSEGMQEFLGPHPDSHVLYPIPDASSAAPDESAAPGSRAPGGPCRLLYTGTAFGAYGRLLLELARALATRPDIEFRIYGAKPDWPPAELERATAAGLYRGFLPFEALKKEMEAADAFLAVMSFEPAMEVMMRTSFTTKFLDYAARAKPILVWGPEYCSPVRLARREAAALTVTVPDATAVLSGLDRVRSDASLRHELAAGAARLSRTVFDPEAIHRVLVDSLRPLATR